MATQQSVRHVNAMCALNVLFREGGMSRADLGRVLGLNRSTTGSIIADLMAERLVIEHESHSRHPGTARVGRPGIVIEIDPAGGTFIGAELGVDRLTVVVTDMVCRQIVHRSISFDAAHRSPETGVRRIAELIRSAMASVADRGPPRGLCVVIPALVKDGVVCNALTMGWRDVPLATMLRQRVMPDLPVMVENDANALAIGETYRGTSQRSDVVAFLLIENGVGGGITVGGRLFRGAFGFAGEFGQLIVGRGGFSGGRQKPGHLESYIGKDALLAIYRGKGGSAAATLADLLGALQRGDPTARMAASIWGRALARGLVQLIAVLNPGLIILGGSGAVIFRHVAAEVTKAVHRELLQTYPAPEIELSTLGPEGAAFGGACLIHQQMFSIDQSRIAQDRPALTLLRD